MFQAFRDALLHTFVVTRGGRCTKVEFQVLLYSSIYFSGNFFLVSQILLSESGYIKSSKAEFDAEIHCLNSAFISTLYWKSAMVVKHLLTSHWTQFCKSTNSINLREEAASQLIAACTPRKSTTHNKNYAEVIFSPCWVSTTDLRVTTPCTNFPV